MIRITVHALAAICVLFASLAPVRAGEGPLTVVELFTSQGCSSCPPADALLSELAAREDVLAISFHVDYWDYIGWRDTLALRESQERQRRYSKAFGRSYVYTPQMVINGAAETTGRDREEALRLIAESPPTAAVPVSLSPAPDGGTKVAVGGGTDADPADVWLIFFDREHSTTITRGENSGRTIRYSNVVRHMERVASWSGEAVEVPLPSGAMPGEACAVLLQSRATGRILGAARMAGGALP